MDLFLGVTVRAKMRASSGNEQSLSFMSSLMGDLRSTAGGVWIEPQIQAGRTILQTNPHITEKPALKNRESSSSARRAFAICDLQFAMGKNGPSNVPCICNLRFTIYPGANRDVRRSASISRIRND